MYPTLLDTKTGRRVDAIEFDYPIAWWTDGNGSCDCNRARAMGVHDDMAEQFGGNTCFGCKRIIAIDAHGDLGGMNKAQALAAMNDEYPDLYNNLEKHLKQCQIPYIAAGLRALLCIDPYKNTDTTELQYHSLDKHLKHLSNIAKGQKQTLRPHLYIYPMWFANSEHP